MKKKKKNQAPESSEQQKKDPKESIPLWLQGLSERDEPHGSDVPDEWRKEEDFLDKGDGDIGDESQDLSDTDVLDSIDEEDLDSFDDEGLAPINEQDESLSDVETPEEVVEIDQDNLEDIDRDELPDWLNELADVNPDTPEISGRTMEPEEAEPLEEFPEEDETTEEVLLESNKEVENSIEITEEQYSEEETLEEAPILEMEESFEEELIPEDEEIPEWLREMIAAEERHSQLENQKLVEESADEPTKPVRIEPDQDLVEDEILDEAEEPDVSENEIEFYETPKSGGFQLIEDMLEENIEEEEEEYISDETEASYPDIEPFAEFEEQEDQLESSEDLEAISDVESPIVELEPIESVEIQEFEESIEVPQEAQLPEEAVEPVDLEIEQEDLSGYEETPEGLVPKFLIAAESSLKNGDIDHALEIIYDFFADYKNLDQIKDWLYKAIESIDCDKSKLWEAVGDIAIQQGKYTEAFNAYAKAIKNLDNLKVTRDEID